MLEVENQPVTTLDELREVLDQKKPGEKATLTLYRPQGEGIEGKTYQVTIYLLEDTESRLGTTIP